MNALIREIVFRPAFDKRDADPKKNYGIHGVDMTWYLKGPEGVVQFVVYTGWHLPGVQADLDSKGYGSSKPMAADIGYHSPKPMYEGQTPMSGNCQVIEGDCYYDGSTLQADELFEVLIEEGGEAVWKKMEQYYRDHFTGEVSA